MITVKKYSDDMRDTWDSFCDNAKNPVFMFKRNYMEYHKDRFTDSSLLFYDDEDLIALFPANVAEGELQSHGGLTYGGFITNTKMTQHTMNECFIALREYAEEMGLKRIYYKVIPHMYHLQPAEEDRYSLFINDAQLIKVESATVLNFQNPLKMPKGRKAQISRAKREKVEVRECLDEQDFYSFIDLENFVLSQHHGTKAVHTGSELYLLYSRFPQNIHLYAAMLDEKMIAGSVIFEYENVIHTQYLAADETARQLGALDLVISTLIDTYKDTKHWLDFGISTENAGRVLNEGLIFQKEGFGGRTNVYESWEMKI